MQLRFTDYLQLDVPKMAYAKTSSGRTVDIDIRRWLNENQTDLKKAEDMEDIEHLPGLEITMEATASDTLINNRIYTGDSVRRRHPTFRSKPMQKFHDSHIDPVGRIIKTKFEQFLSGTDFDQARLKPARQENGKVKGQPSGRVLVKARILDADTIEKIQDGRLTTVSQGSRAATASCNICHQDWLQDGFCGHMPGTICEVEDAKRKNTKKMLAFLVVDVNVYDELSFVNTPAWSQAMVLEVADMQELSSQDQLAIDLDRKIQDEIIPELPQEKLVSRLRDVILYDALGDPLIIIEDGKVIEGEVIEVNIQQDVPVDDQVQDVIVDNISLESQEANMSAEQIKDLEAKIQDLQKQVKVLTENLEKSGEEVKTADEESKNLKAETDGLRGELETAKSELIKRDAEEIMHMQEILGKIELENEDARKKGIEDLESKDRGYLLGMLDTLRPDFSKCIKDLKEKATETDELRAKAGKLESQRVTDDSPNAEPDNNKDEDDLLAY